MPSLTYLAWACSKEGITTMSLGAPATGRVPLCGRMGRVRVSTCMRRPIPDRSIRTVTSWECRLRRGISSGWSAGKHRLWLAPVMWSGSSLQTSTVTSLHNSATMAYSTAYGAYTHNGVAHQVGVSYADTSTAQGRARVWTGTAASALDLTPAGYFSAGLRGGFSDGTQEYVYGAARLTSAFSDKGLPTFWTGLGGAYETFDTTVAYSGGEILYANQNNAVGQLINGSSRTHAALWNTADGSVIDLHSFLPASFQGLGTSYALYDDGLGHIYGMVQPSSGPAELPIIWTVVPEPSSMLLVALVGPTILVARRRRKQRIAHSS